MTRIARIIFLQELPEIDHEFFRNNNLTIRDVQEQKLMVNSWPLQRHTLYL